MDEESLFRDIHNHLIHQAQEGGKMDTEMKLAERFNVSRYRVRRVLDILTRMGIIHRAQKRGLTVLDPEPEKLSKNIGSQLTVSGFNAMEDLEARMLIEHAVLELAVKRLTPMTAGRLTEKVGQLERVMISGAAVIEIHQSFRLELISGCGNRVLQVFAESLLTECLRLLRETGESLPSDYRSDLLTGDRRLLDAIKQGSMDEACEALNTVIQLEVAGAADDLRRGEAAAGSMDKKA